MRPFRHLLIGSFVFLLLPACNEERPKEQPQGPEHRLAAKNSKTSPLPQFVEVSIPNLRLRSTPDLEGAVLERLALESVVEYLNDSTNFTTLVEMGGEDRYEHWYKVRSGNGNEGWVYGGCIKFLGERESLRFQSIKESETPIPLSQKEEIDPMEQAQMNRFGELLKKTSIQKKSALEEAIQYYEGMFPNRKAAASDWALAKLIAFQQQVHSYWVDRLPSSKFQAHLAELKRYGSVDMQQNASLRELDQLYLAFALGPKGELLLVPNIDKFQRRVYRIAPANGRIFLDLYAQDIEEPVLKDGEIIRPITELAARLISWDKFLLRLPNYELKDWIEEQKSLYLRALLQGTANRPAFAGQPKRLEDDFQLAYKNLLEQMGEASLILKMQPYVEVLAQENYIYNERVRAAQAKVYE
ncbi:SH3 domain-containing protein [Saprospira grandis]|uniref:SH3b domain-containing protein n=1 Tax=Saprospira grandis (strain Lewin) TaxID=984262 RepID=H6KZK8_SAPGL|nr:SH3 domain-containing protein [Saprospira grandis]AFC25784.1 hypothetical protein SGRA_3056 [Saprospira grandis str. Lewin]